MSRGQRILLGLLVLMFAAFFLFDAGQYLNLSFLQQQQIRWEAYYQAHPQWVAFWFFLIYVLSTAVSLPGASLLTLVAGALFGLGVGTLLVSFASTIGATLAFWVSRYLLHDWIQERFHDRLQSVNRGIHQDGPFYLFTLRLVVVFPFWLVNVLMGLTPIKTRTYYWVSQLGMLPATLVFVNAGTQLANIHTPSDILSPWIIGSFAILGVFPLLARLLIRRLKSRQVLKAYQRPSRFDYNLLVIGAGSAGLVSAYIGSSLKAKVALVEKADMGGDCLNTGCVPSKALIRSARFLAEVARCQHYGIDHAKADFDFATIMDRVAAVIRDVAPHDSVDRYTGLGVDCLQGEARLTSPWTVSVGEQTLSARRIIVATGAGPFIPPIEGLSKVVHYTSENIWRLRTLPERLLVLGGGPVGVELAQSFARFGSKVTLVEQAARLLLHEDEAVSTRLRQALEQEGIEVLLRHRAVQFDCENQQQTALLECEGASRAYSFDAALIAVGRHAFTEGLGLASLGIMLNEDGTIPVDATQQTHVPTIYACGDVVGPYQLTHAAANQAWYASVNALFGHLWSFKVKQRVIPRVTFTDPEIATVGLTEDLAKQQRRAYELTEYDLADLDRAMVDGENKGVVRVLTLPGKDVILGATIVGSHAGEMIQEFVLAMTHGLGLKKLLATIHAYPTHNEANKYVAGAWQKKHAPEKLLALIGRYQTRLRHPE